MVDIGQNGQVGGIIAYFGLICRTYAFSIALDFDEGEGVLPVEILRRAQNDM